MFRYSTIPNGPPSETKGTIYFQEIPRLGNIKDIDGKLWNIGCIAYGHVYAVPTDELHPYYNSTTMQNFGVVQQSWHAYKFEVVET